MGIGEGIAFVFSMVAAFIITPMLVMMVMTLTNTAPRWIARFTYEIIWMVEVVIVTIVNKFQREFEVDCSNLNYLCWEDTDEPMILYHGSPVGWELYFNGFSLDHYCENTNKKYLMHEIPGLYFTTSQYAAKEYSERREEELGEAYDPLVLIVQIRANKPHYVSFSNWHRARGFSQAFRHIRKHRNDAMVWHKLPEHKRHKESFALHREAAEFVVFDERQVEIIGYQTHDGRNQFLAP